MPDSIHLSKAELVQMSEYIWAELDSCLSSLTVDQMTALHDEQGWSIKDHISHLAAWEQALLLLFDGKPRYQTLGISLDLAKEHKMDEINAKIQERWAPEPIQAVISNYRLIHGLLMDHIMGVSDTDLNQSVSDFFPHEAPPYGRQVLDIFRNNIVHHVGEHLSWIRKTLAATPTFMPANPHLTRWHAIVKNRDLQDLKSMLAEEVVFHSPYIWEPYEGRRAVAVILATVSKVFKDFTYHREVIDGNNWALEFSALVEDCPIKGIDLIQIDNNGQIIHFEVFVRPAKGLQILGETMVSRLSRFASERKVS